MLCLVSCSFCRYSKQQITLDEYRTLAQDSVKQANARTAAVARQRHAAHAEAEAAARQAARQAARAAEGETSAVALREERDALKVVAGCFL
jgi:hypothetical protein